MLSGLPLLETVRAALTGDGLLAGFMGGTANVFTLDAPDNQSLPYVTLSFVSATDWSAADFDGDEIQFQVAAHFDRGKSGSATGALDVSKAIERIRDVLTHRDGFDLNASPAEGETVSLDFLTGPMRVAPAADKRLVSCRYVSAAIIPGLNDDPAGGVVLGKARGQSISGVVTFRALISPSN